jgi:tetratricopeptide (TPR) repeat protein
MLGRELESARAWMPWTDLLRALTHRRSRTTIAMFRLACRYRDEGRFEDAVALVGEGLKRDPRSLVGHLLAGSLYAVFRQMDDARTEFQQVLMLDALHPRALLGLARIALEEDDVTTCVTLLRRALDRYPDFPEAQALLEAVSGPPAQRGARAMPMATVHVDRLHAPTDCRELLLIRDDATVLAIQPRCARTGELATRTARIARLAAATLERSGLGRLRHAIIDDPGESTLLKTDGVLTLTLTFHRDVERATGLGHLARVWTNARQVSGAAA